MVGQISQVSGVAPALQALISRAMEISPVAFGVRPGGALRTAQEQAAFQRAGWSQTSNSIHINGRAIDLTPLTNGVADPTNRNAYLAINSAMQQASQELGIPYTWGGSWKGFQDLPHFQITPQAAAAFKAPAGVTYSLPPSIDFTPAEKYELGNAGYPGVKAPTVPELFSSIEDQYGLPSGYLTGAYGIESNFGENKGVSSAGARGPFQFIPSTAQQYGLNNLNSLAASAVAAARLAADNAEGLRSALGREPTAGELYLAHQQGLDGAVGLLTDPNALASQAVGGYQRIVQNLPPDMQARAATMTAGEFASFWTGQYDQKLAQNPIGTIAKIEPPAPEALAYDPGSLAIPAGTAASAVAASVPSEAAQAALAFAEAQPVNSPALAAVTDLAARSPVPPSAVSPVPAGAAAAISPTSVAGEDLSAPRTTGYPTMAIAPSTGIVPRAGPFFDWAQVQQPLPAAPSAPPSFPLAWGTQPDQPGPTSPFGGSPSTSFDQYGYGLDRPAVAQTAAASPYPSDVQMPQPLGAVQMALPTARPTPAEPVISSPAVSTGGSETLSRQQMQSRYGWTPQAADAAFPAGTENTGEGKFARAVLGGDPGEMKAAYANVWDPTTLTKIITGLNGDQFNATKANIYNNHDFMSRFAFGQFKDKAGPVTASTVTLPTPRPEPASVFTDRSLAAGPFFNWSQILQPFSDTKSYAEPEKSSSPGLTAAASVASSEPRYGGGGGSPSAPVYSGFTPSSSSSGGDTASSSKSYNAGTPVQSSYNVPSSADAGYAAAPASRAATTQPANPWAAMAAASAPAAPAASAYNAAPFSASDIAASLSPSMTFESQAAPAAARPSAVRSVAPVRPQVARTVMPVMHAPMGGDRYVSNPAPAASSQSQKLAAALSSIDAARNAGYTTTPKDRLGGLAAQGYSMPNYSSGSGGAVYAYHPDGQGGGTYVNSYGQTMNY